jgi:uncharacterized membrane protein
LPIGRSVAAMSEPDLTPKQLESFSDGVIAIVVTIMALELRPPANPAWSSLVGLWPDFLSYLISFGFVAIFWVNLRHVLRRAQVLTEPILWANISLLFLLSLIPFGTAYVGRSHIAALPMMVYALLLEACGLNFGLLRGLIAARLTDPAERRRFNGPLVQAIGAASGLTFLVVVALSFVSPLAALILIAASAIPHAVPITRR